MFANLLASILDPETVDKTLPSYAKVLAQLAPLDARIISKAYKQIKSLNRQYESTSIKITTIADFFEKPESIILLSFQNLWRLGICSHGTDIDHLNQAKQIVFTDYGWKLMDSCQFQN